jgi:hypothetical protein
MGLNRTLRWAFAACMATIASPASPGPVASDRYGGAVVEEVTPSLPGARAGIEAGVVLRSITPGARGAQPVAVRDPFDVVLTELMWSRVGPVTMHVSGKGPPRDANVGVDDWGLKLRPVLSPPQEARYAAVAGKLAGRDVAGYCDGIAPIAAELEREHAPRSAAWLSWRCAEAAGEARDWKRSEPALQQALGGPGRRPGRHGLGAAAARDPGHERAGMGALARRGRARAGGRAQARSGIRAGAAGGGARAQARGVPVALRGRRRAVRAAAGAHPSAVSRHAAGSGSAQPLRAGAAQPRETRGRGR